MQGLARGLVPDDDRLALVGDADGGDARFAERGDELTEHGLYGIPDLVGVVLDPPGLREVLRELAIRRAHAVAPVVERDGPHSGGPGIDGDDDALIHGAER